MRSTCPNCDRRLLSSISSTCGWCGFNLPDALKPTPIEIQKIQTQEAEDHRRERELEQIAKESNERMSRAIRRQL